MNSSENPHGGVSGFVCTVSRPDFVLWEVGPEEHRDADHAEGGVSCLTNGNYHETTSQVSHNFL